MEGGVFLSVVGQQPAATGVLLKSWVEASGSPAEIWLLATSWVERRGIAGRLLGFCQRLVPQARCQAAGIAAGLEDEGARPSALTWLRDYFGSRQPEQVVFAADPGPSFLTAALARHLPADAAFLHADSDLVVLFERWNGLEISKILAAADLGFDELLALYGLRARVSQEGLDPILRATVEKQNIGVPDHIRQVLEFPELADNGKPPRLELAFESRGRLFAPCAVTGRDLKQRAREVERLRARLRGLEPRISVLCTDEHQRRRLRSAGFETVSARRLRGWIQLGRAARPGDVVEPYAAGGEQAPEILQGARGDGEPLLVWMGAVPSATLTSIWTHRPRELVLLYDARTPVIREKIGLLSARRQTIPAGRIFLVPSDHLGRDVSRWILDNYPKAKADVSPGTKAQTEVFARLPGLKLWS